MTRSATLLEAEALELPPDARARMALHLLDSLGAERPSSSRSANEAAWIEESHRRLEAYHRGEMGSRPAEDVVAELERSAS
jgi:putative addiction module component (TIGR02574 family)